MSSPDPSKPGRAPEGDLDLEHESSGVTSLPAAAPGNMVPVPAPPKRLLDFDGGSTQYFSVAELWARRPTNFAEGAEQAGTAAPRPGVALGVPSAAPAKRRGLLASFRQASLVRQATLIMVPLLVGLLLVTPVLKPSRGSAAGTGAKATAPGTVASGATTPKPAPLAEPQAEGARAEEPVRSALPPPSPHATPGHAVSLERAAADSLAVGDFARAAVLYSLLSQREPNNPAYREATRILTERVRGHAP